MKLFETQRKTRQTARGAGNADDQGAFGFRFASHWSKAWIEYFGSIN